MTAPDSSAAPLPKPRAPTLRTRWKRWGWQLVLLVAILGGGLQWGVNARWAQPAASFAPVTVATTPRLPARFRVAFWNLHRGLRPDGVEDLTEAARSLSDFDLIGLAEISQPRWGGGRDQVTRLSQSLQHPGLFVPVETGLAGWAFGLGALSSSGWKNASRTPLPFEAGNGYRGYLHLEIPGSQGTLHCLITHLDRKAERLAQIDALREKFLALPPPVILMGDLNTKRTDPRLQALAREPGVLECLGERGTGKLISRRIDWIFVRGLKCHAAGLDEQSVSDHPLAWAELEWLPDASPTP